MPASCKVSIVRVGAMVTLVLVLAGCTKGGQFDPTTLLDNDMFGNKTPLKGQREPVFPNGVPGATTGIPADLYKGYQPPPDPTANADAGATSVLPPGSHSAKAEAEEKPKVPSAKPKVARGRRKPPTEIRVGLTKHSKPLAQAQPQTSQTVWPAPPSTAQTQSSQTVWPAPTPANQAQSSQTVWPAAPAAGSVQQSSQSVWPNPSATNTIGQ